MDRRDFLKGLFGAVAVAAVGTLPKALLAAPEDKFIERAKFFASLVPDISGGVEIYGNGKDYSFSPLPGFSPLREESNRLATQALRKFFGEFADAPTK